jgi:hypothetical protein
VDLSRAYSITNVVASASSLPAQATPPAPTSLIKPAHACRVRQPQAVCKPSKRANAQTCRTRRRNTTKGMTCQLSGPVLRGRHRQMAERGSAAREVKIASREPFEMVGEEVDTTAMLIGVCRERIYIPTPSQLYIPTPSQLFLDSFNKNISNKKSIIQPYNLY